MHTCALYGRVCMCIDVCVGMFVGSIRIVVSGRLIKCKLKDCVFVHLSSRLHVCPNAQVPAAAFFKDVAS